MVNTFVFLLFCPLLLQANRSDAAAAVSGGGGGGGGGGGEGGENPARPRPKNVLCPSCGMGNEVPGKEIFSLNFCLNFCLISFIYDF